MSLVVGKRFVLICKIVGIAIFSAIATLSLARAYVTFQEHRELLDKLSFGRTINAEVRSIEQSALSGRRTVALTWLENGVAVEGRLEVRNKYLWQCGTKIGAPPKCKSIELFDARHTPLGLYVKAENDPHKWSVRFPWVSMFLVCFSMVWAALVHHIWKKRRDEIAWDFTF